MPDPGAPGIESGLFWEAPTGVDILDWGPLPGVGDMVKDVEAGISFLENSATGGGGAGAAFFLTVGLATLPLLRAMVV